MDGDYRNSFGTLYFLGRSPEGETISKWTVLRLL
jgi:hypothetical protein